jgi:hypothetical protein
VFLADMRDTLASIHRVLQGIGSSDRAQITAAARRTGNSMARATPASIRARIPQSFRDIGGPTHQMFEELAIRAETDDVVGLQTAIDSLDQSAFATLPNYDLLKGGNANRVYLEAESL